MTFRSNGLAFVKIPFSLNSMYVGSVRNVSLKVAMAINCDQMNPFPYILYEYKRKINLIFGNNHK